MPGRKKTIMPLLPYRVIPFYVALIICPNRVQDAKCGEHRISEEALSPRFRHVLLLGSTVPDKSAISIGDIAKSQLTWNAACRNT